MRSVLSFFGFGLLILAAACAPVLPASAGSGPPAVADTDPPTGSVHSPSPGTWVNTRSKEVSVEFRDLDGIELSSLSATLDGDPLHVTTYLWDVNWTDVLAYAWVYPVADGPHAAEMRASDRLGNGPTVVAWSFSVDATPPAVNITYPVDNPLLADGSVTLAWTGSDNVSGIDRYEIRLDDGPYINVGAATSFPFRGLTPGMHYFYVVAYDRAGNSNRYYADTIAVATVPAPPPATPPPTNATIQVTLSGPDQIPAWGIGVIVITTAEAVAVAVLALRLRGEAGRKAWLKRYGRV